MTLEQAIQHCKDKAKELRQEAILFNNNPMYSDNTVADCLECANEHEQLAEWLTELKEAREELAEWHKLKLICASEGIVVYKVKENDK